MPRRPPRRHIAAADSPAASAARRKSLARLPGAPLESTPVARHARGRELPSRRDNNGNGERDASPRRALRYARDYRETRTADRLTLTARMRAEVQAAPPARATRSFRSERCLINVSARKKIDIRCSNNQMRSIPLIAEEKCTYYVLGDNK